MTPTKDDRSFLVFRQTRGNRYTFPLLLGCIEKEGLAESFHIRIARSSEGIRREVGSGKAILCFSFMTPHLEEVQEEVERFRRELPGETIFLAGGSHATGDPRGTLALGFDYVFAGEGERTFPFFLRQYLEGKPPDTRIIRDAEGLLPLDEIPPFPAQGRYFAPMEITPGCLYECTFCQTPRLLRRFLRHRSPWNVAGYLQTAVARGYTQATLRSSNAFAYSAHGLGQPNLLAMEELFRECQQAGVRGIHFGCYPSEVRPDWVTPEGLQLVKKYCRNHTIVLGAQSGSDALLERLKRRHTAGEAWIASRSIQQAGFTPHVDFVFGFPAETLEDRKLSRKLMEEMILHHGARIHAHTYLPLPATPLFSQEPSRLDPETKNFLLYWEKEGRLDGWWKEQEIMAWKIIGWRDQGLIKSKE